MCLHGSENEKGLSGCLDGVTDHTEPFVMSQWHIFQSLRTVCPLPAQSCQGSEAKEARDGLSLVLQVQ